MNGQCWNHDEVAELAYEMYRPIWPRRLTDQEAAGWVHQIAKALTVVTNIAACEAAVHEWADTQTGWPSPVDLVRLAQDFARSMQADQAARERAHAEAGSRPAPPTVAQEYLEIIRAINGLGGQDDHDHRHGSERCPVCGPGSVIRDQTRDLLATLPDPETSSEFYRCRECGPHGDQGHVTAGIGVRPCRICNPVGFDRWAGGHWDPGHECSECAQVRRGRYTTTS